MVAFRVAFPELLQAQQTIAYHIRPVQFLEHPLFSRSRLVQCSVSTYHLPDSCSSLFGLRSLAGSYYHAFDQSAIHHPTSGDQHSRANQPTSK
jgi:hypothetical protein